ncbi:helix-turn-helix transcriptional regulator [Acrocarpospora sp. B8E8]|uniref:helix-turn-helix domain-containing protein n=1 Tax=Acrocarpospora sp. B8E8 TaxID=3153572 RepID=UPI00325C7973
MPAPQELDPAASPRALVGSEVRRYRKAAGWSQEMLAERINFSKAMVSLVETAERAPTHDFLARCEKALGLNQELVRLWPLVVMNAGPQWFLEWLELEPLARTIRTWQPLNVPGLLQTEEYARAVLSGEPGLRTERVEELVLARMNRQRIFDQPVPPVLWVVIDETLLWHPLGGKEVMRSQLEHLIEMADHPFITIQVVPLDSGSTAGLPGAFAIADVPARPATIYLESPARGYITDHEQEVAAISNRYEAISADALPGRASIELIRETMVNKWS